MKRWRIACLIILCAGVLVLCALRLEPYAHSSIIGTWKRVEGNRFEVNPEQEYSEITYIFGPGGDLTVRITYEEGRRSETYDTAFSVDGDRYCGTGFWQVVGDTLTITGDDGGYEILVRVK